MEKETNGNKRRKRKNGEKRERRKDDKALKLKTRL